MNKINCTNFPATILILAKNLDHTFLHVFLFANTFLIALFRRCEGNKHEIIHLLL